MTRAAGFALCLLVSLSAAACAGDRSDEEPAAATSPAPPSIADAASEEPTPESVSPTPTPEPTPEPPLPSLGSQDDIREFFDDLVDDIEWQNAPTPKGRTRLLGVVPDTYATVEIFGRDDAVDEVAYQVVYDGTDFDTNLDRGLPMVQLARKYASEEAGKFVGAQLDGFTGLPAIPEKNRTKRFGDVFVRVLGIDVINTVNVALSTGHRPTGP